MEIVEICDRMRIEDIEFDVRIQKSNRKTLSIMISEQGELLVKAPLALSRAKIDRFINQKRYWIYKQLRKQREMVATRIVLSEEEKSRLRQRARVVLTEKTIQYEKILNVKCMKIRIGNQRTRWGSCSSAGTISYNWHLILMPDEIQDYVVVHELCHLVEMNHSKQFWELVQKMIPDYKERRAWLKEHGGEYVE